MARGESESKDAEDASSSSDSESESKDSEDAASSSETEQGTATSTKDAPQPGLTGCGGAENKDAEDTATQPGLTGCGGAESKDAEDASSSSDSEIESKVRDTKPSSKEEEEKAPAPTLKRIRLVVETTAEHLQRHDPKVEWQSCARCAYYYKRAVLEKACSFEEEYTREKLCYLIEAPDLGVNEWGLGCVVCRWAGLKTAFAKCRIDSLSLMLKKDQACAACGFC